VDIQDQRRAIYDAEAKIETVLDEMAEKSKLHASSIELQTILDQDKNVAPALKVNIKVSPLRE